MDFLLTKSKHSFINPTMSRRPIRAPHPPHCLLPTDYPPGPGPDNCTPTPLRQDSSLCHQLCKAQNCSRDLTLQVTTLWSWDFLSMCITSPASTIFALEAKTFHTQNLMALIKIPASLHRPECRRLVNWGTPQPRSPTVCAQNETIYRHLLCHPTWQQTRQDLPSSLCLLASDLCLSRDRLHQTSKLPPHRSLEQNSPLPGLSALLGSGGAGMKRLGNARRSIVQGW